jgi:hypothetical protein
MSGIFDAPDAAFSLLFMSPGECLQTVIVSVHVTFAYKLSFAPNFAQRLSEFYQWLRSLVVGISTTKFAINAKVSEGLEAVLSPLMP